MEIKPGEIIVEDIDVIIDLETVKVWHVDLRSKYAEILAYSKDQVLLHAIFAHSGKVGRSSNRADTKP